MKIEVLSVDLCQVPSEDLGLTGDQFKEKRCRNMSYNGTSENLELYVKIDRDRLTDFRITPGAEYKLAVLHRESLPLSEVGNNNEASNYGRGRSVHEVSDQPTTGDQVNFRYSSGDPSDRQGGQGVDHPDNRFAKDKIEILYSKQTKELRERISHIENGIKKLKEIIHSSEQRQQKEEALKCMEKYSRLCMKVIADPDFTKLIPTNIDSKSGGFGTVHFLKDHSGQIFAVKKATFKNGRDSAKAKKDIEQEACLYRMMSHENILRYYNVYREGQADMFIILEYMEKGSIRDKINRNGVLSENDIKKYISMVLDALIYLHGIKIIHRDIKSGNILLGDDDIVKLCDFGLSRILTNNKLNTKGVGTRLFQAPEIFTGVYGDLVDIYSVGCTMVEMKTNHPPLGTKITTEDDYKEYKKSIVEKQLREEEIMEGSELPDDTSVLLRELLKRCLVFEPTHRPSAEVLKDDPFFKNN